MKQTRLLAVFVLVAASLIVAQDKGVAAASLQSSTAMVNPEAQPALVRILAPADGQRVPSNFGDLRFELMQPATTGEPDFIIQLDSAEPVHTSSMDYALPELLPGSHSILVALVDANNSPIPGGSATVQFTVQSVPQPAHRNVSRETKLSRQMIAGAAPAAPIPPELRNDGDIKLPLAGSPLPLLSLIGFGLLIGGAAQAMRKH